jgi:hypothetical protein
MGLTKMIEHVLVGILGSMDTTAHNAKHDKRKNMKPGQERNELDLSYESIILRSIKWYEMLQNHEYYSTIFP